MSGNPDFNFGIGLRVIVQALILYIILPFYFLNQHAKSNSHYPTHNFHRLLHIHSKHKANINANVLGLSAIIGIIKYSKLKAVVN